jgi:hypothetical protein
MTPELIKDLNEVFGKHNISPFHLDLYELKNKLIRDEYYELTNRMKGKDAIQALADKHQTSVSTVRHIIYYITM